MNKIAKAYRKYGKLAHNVESPNIKKVVKKVFRVD